MARIIGHAHWVLTNPDGTIAGQGETHNIVTANGEQVYAKRGAGLATPPNEPIGMKLGTGSTTPSRTGAGSTLATYLSNSHKLFDSGFPTVTTPSGTTRVTYQCTFAAGKATSASPITEAVIVNNALADSDSAASNVVARVLLSGIPSKSAAQELIVTWTHDLTGG
ncbi:hypothetical protein [Glutamicibacter ardleyensis]|uniref:Uncharacterized protein n=1 Tax=Glutamicibacter ardleyensis TaxID=225894 RepID=A0ABQ2DEW4_9MICC|nr:hypothetical protein [Glutamicibacter ardleyensis]GGJ55644.1 hypothetical protein GCM10007173_13020 [Glutamicibacter ardleyensis]